MKKEQVLAKLRSCGLVAVVRAKDADDAMRIAERLIERLHWRRSARKARPRPSRRRLITCLTAMPADWPTI